MNVQNNSIKLLILLLSTFISGLGITTFFIAVNSFVEHISNSSIGVGVLNATSYCSLLLFLPYIGIICDKYSRRNVLLIIYTLGALLQIAVSFSLNDLSKVMLLIVLFIVTNILTIIKSVDQVSRAAYLQSVFEAKYYQSTNQWLESVRQGITFIGGGTAALFMKTPSLATILHFNVLTFILAIVLILLLPKDRSGHEIVTNQSYWSKLKSGYSVLASLDKYLLWVLVVSILPYIIVVAMSVTYPAFFNQLHIANATQFYAALSIPYGLGALAASYFTRKQHVRFDIFFIKYSCIFSVALFAGAFFHSIYIIYLMLSTIGYCHAAIRIQRNTFIMQIVDNNNIGKALSFFEIIFTFGVVILSILLSAVCDLIFAKYSWVAAALFLMMATVSIGFMKSKK